MGGFALVGEAPNQATVGRPRLWLLPDSSGIPHAANRLLEYSGLTRAEYLSTFTVRTDVWPDLRRKRVREGRELAERVLQQAHAAGCQGVVVLGAWAARAFSMERAELMEWQLLFGLAPLRAVARLPHPCERTGWWFDPVNLGRARAFFRTLRDLASSAGAGGPVQAAGGPGAGSTTPAPAVSPGGAP